MKAALLAGILLVAACVNLPKTIEQQRQCRETHPRFVAMVEWLKANTVHRTQGLDNDLVRLYLAEAGLLALKVEYNDLDERVAWIELEKSLAFMQRQSDGRAARGL